METQSSGANPVGANVPSLPVEEKKSPAFHLFLYLVSFLSLGFVITGTIGNFFQMINKYLPDPVNSDQYYDYDFNQEFLKFAISALIVAAPIYFGVLYLINKKLDNGDIRPSSLVRKFVTYLAMFVFSAMSLGSLVSLVYNYLDGELTQKIFLKIVVFFGVSLFYLGFYFWEIRRTDFLAKKFYPLYFASIFIAAVALIVGFIVVDSPRVVREKKQDREIVYEMQNFSSRLDEAYRKNKKLPEVGQQDIKLERGIRYTRIDDINYELCASFKHAAKKQFSTDEWAHPAGDYCFKKDISSDIEPYMMPKE